jgi:Ser/Thr protein kinase RdoA (MazF antagonist)
MKPFDQLTRLGRARRLRKVAITALASFDLGVARVALLGSFTNTLFRVDTTAGDRYVLRCCAPGWRTETDLRSEALWLEALARDTEIGAPVPLRSRKGEVVVSVDVDGVARSQRCTVMSWIPGVLLGKRLSVETLVQMGELFAALHAHGAVFVPPPGFTTRKMSAFLARDEPDVLFASRRLEMLPPHCREVLMLTRARVDEAYAARYVDAAGLLVIHNDLWHDNIKVDRGRLRPLDFEDTVWGYPVQDIASAFQDLISEVAPEAYVRYVEAFRKGYERRSPWPERYVGEVDTFQAGRMLWIANYVAVHEAPYLQGHIAGLTPWLEVFLDTGRVRRVVPSEDPSGA